MPTSYQRAMSYIVGKSLDEKMPRTPVALVYLTLADVEIVNDCLEYLALKLDAIPSVDSPGSKPPKRSYQVMSHPNIERRLSYVFGRLSSEMVP